MGFTEWWEALSLTTQVFYCIATPATLVLLVQTVLLFLGVGEHADGDMDFSAGVDGDADTDGIFGDGVVEIDDGGFDFLSLFTLRGIIAFLVVFGWVGAAMSSAEAPLYLTIPVAFVSGFAMMMVIALLLRAVMRLRSDGILDNRNALGASGRVYLTIPAARTGEGKIQLLLQGVLAEREAVTDEAEPIPTGTEVVVTSLSGQTVLVVKRK